MQAVRNLNQQVNPNQFNEYAWELKTIRDQAKVLKQREAQLVQFFKSEVFGAAGYVIKDEELTVSKVNSERVNLDTKKLKATLPMDVWSQFQKTINVCSISVTVNE